MADKRITDVDFLDSLNGDESFFVNQNNSLKQISKKNIVFQVADGGTGATTATEALKNLGAASQAELNAVSAVANNANSEALSAYNLASNAQATADAAIPKANFVFDTSTGTLNITL